jgi:hypothetical protein
VLPCLFAAPELGQYTACDDWAARAHAVLRSVLLRLPTTPLSLVNRSSYVLKLLRDMRWLQADVAREALRLVAEWLRELDAAAATATPTVEVEVLVQRLGLCAHTPALSGDIQVRTERRGSTGARRGWRASCAGGAAEGSAHLYAGLRPWRRQHPARRGALSKRQRVIHLARGTTRGTASFLGLITCLQLLGLRHRRYTAPSARLPLASGG